MGRPIKARYFVKGGPKTPSDVVKYKAVTVAINANGTLYSQGSVASFSAPQDAAGVQATLNLTINSTTGAVNSAAIANPGSGYNVAPTVTITTATAKNNVAGSSTLNSFTLTNISTASIYVGMKVDAPAAMQALTYVSAVGTNTVTLNKTQTATSATNSFTFNDYGSGATFTVGLTQAELDTGNIACTAYISTASSAVSSAIIKQEGSHRYLVENAQGRGICKLTTGTVTAGLMSITATDANGNTYSVTKLTARKATVTRKTQNGSNAWVYGVLDPNTGTYLDVARWTAGSAVGTDKTLSTTKISIGTY